MNTPIADMIAEMLKNCIPNEMIILAVRTTELALQGSRPTQDDAAERRRAYDREYRRKERDKSDDNRTTSDDQPPYLGNSKSLAEVEVKKERKSRGTKLSSDWVPSEKHYEEGLRRGMNRTAVDDLAETMRLWCATNANTAKTTRADWDSFFMSWIRREKVIGNGISNIRTDAGSGRANTKEAQFIAAMGRGALGALAQGASGRQDGAVSRGDDSPRQHDPDWRAKNVG